MIETLLDYDGVVVVGVLLSWFATALAALAVTRWVATLPADWFVRPRRHAGAARQLVGAALVVAGVAMLVLPGPGLLVLLVGVGTLQFPGKHDLLMSVLSRPTVRSSFDQLRARFGQPPLALEPARVRVPADADV